MKLHFLPSTLVRCIMNCLFLDFIHPCKLLDRISLSAAIPSTGIPHSCDPCNVGDYEVHVIDMYEPIGNRRGFRQQPTNVITVPVGTG